MQLISVTLMEGDYVAMKFLFQHDGAPCHKQDCTTAWFRWENIEVCQWPSHSIQLNVFGTRSVN